MPFKLYNDQPDDIFYVTDNNPVVLYSTDDSERYGFMNLNGEWVIEPKYVFGNEDYPAGSDYVFASGVQAMWDLPNNHHKKRISTKTVSSSRISSMTKPARLIRAGRRDNPTGHINLQGEEVYMRKN